MKLRRITGLFFVIAIAAVAAYSQNASIKIALINTDIFGDEKAGITKYINANTSLNAEFQPKETELKATATRLDDLSKEIQQLQAKFASPPAGYDMEAARNTLTTKTEEGQRLQIEFKRKQEDAKTQYERRQKIVLGPISTEIGNAITAFGKARGIDMILDPSKLADSGALLYLNDAADMTDAFIKDFNAKNSGVPVK
jgi:Skp family chaperone for outer membrane proteins